jgi:hypothetical protein
VPSACARLRVMGASAKRCDRRAFPTVMGVDRTGMTLFRAGLW